MRKITAGLYQSDNGKWAVRRLSKGADWDCIQKERLEDGTYGPGTVRFSVPRLSDADEAICKWHEDFDLTQRFVRGDVARDAILDLVRIVWVGGQADYVVERLEEEGPYRRRYLAWDSLLEPAAVCDVCQDGPVAVTVGCVEYCSKCALAEAVVTALAGQDIKARLEYLRGEIRAERISYGELADLQGLAEHIDPSDVELLEWAGVPEFPDPDAERVLAALGDDPDDHGPGCDGPYNCVCSTEAVR